MAYKKSEMITQCINAIQEHDLVFIEEIISFVPFSKPTFYAHGLNEVDSIKKELEDRKVEIKAGMRKEWRKSTNATLQIALYRMLANQHEYERLTLERIDHTSKGDKIQPINVNVVKDENIDKYKAHLEKIAQLN